VGSAVRIGSRFAFVDAHKLGFREHAFAPDLHPSLATTPARRMTLPLSQYRKTNLPGFGLQAHPDAQLRLNSLTVDRDLYRHLRDTVHLLLLDLDYPATSVEVTLQCESIEVAQQPVALDEHGVGLAEFSGLPVGNYQVTRLDDPLSDCCRFQVA